MRQHASGASERIEVGGSSLEVSIDSDEFELGRTVLPDWVTQSARAVADYFGQFPVPRARVQITVSQGGRVSNGVSFREGGAHCRISVSGDSLRDPAVAILHRREAEMNHFVSELPFLAQVGQCRVLALWAQLGVRHNAQGVALDDQAPWAAIRSGICGTLAGRLRI